MEKLMSKEKKSVWETLSAIDVNDKAEEKNGMTYLSWAWAWGKLKDNYPEATFKKHIHDGMAYIKDEKGNAFVEVTVTVEGISATELFPVLNYNNKPIQNPNAFEVNTALQRGLAKAIAYHGLGHYIYAGEDLPQSDGEERQSKVKTKEVVDTIQEATPTPPPPESTTPDVLSAKDDTVEKTNGWDMVTDAFTELMKVHNTYESLGKLWKKNKSTLNLLETNRPSDYEELLTNFKKRAKELKEKANDTL